MMVAVTKLLQHLANGTKPGTHQPRLARLDGFIERNAAALDTFYNELLRVPNPLVASSESEDVVSAPPQAAVENALVCLQQKLQRNWPMIVKNLTAAEGADSPTLQAIASWSPQ
jgi:hypothetical protein